MSHDLAAHARGVCGPPFCAAPEPLGEHYPSAEADAQADRIRRGEVDAPLEAPDRLSVAHAQRAAQVARDERDTLGAEDPRHDDLSVIAEAWDERANALEAAEAAGGYGAGTASIDACIRYARSEGLAAGGVDRYLATDAQAELDVLLAPTISAKWLTRPLPAGDRDVYVYVLEYRLAGHVYTGEAALPPGLNGTRLDDVSLRRVQAGAAKALREQIIPTGVALDAAIATGRPRR